jgi:hypothetical protein
MQAPRSTAGGLHDKRTAQQPEPGKLGRHAAGKTVTVLACLSPAGQP